MNQLEIQLGLGRQEHGIATVPAATHVAQTTVQNVDFAKPQGMGGLRQPAEGLRQPAEHHQDAGD